jgi:hypothetical protein
VEEFAMPDKPPVPTPTPTPTPAPTPTVSVNAGNDAAPHGGNFTSIGVFGSNFPPGSTVKIQIDPAGRHGTADVSADGIFGWNDSVRPQLGCGSPVVATVTGSDGLMVTGEADVFCPGDAS